MSPYGITKQAFEHYLKHFYSAYGLSYLSLRFANLYGPRQQVTKPAGEGNVISLFLDKLLVTGEPLTIFGDGQASRDFVFIDDAVAAILTGLDQDITGSVNVSTGRGISVNELVAELLKIHREDHAINYLPFRTGEVLHSVISPASAKTELKWRPKTSFKRGLRKTYDWYKQEFSSKDKV